MRRSLSAARSSEPVSAANPTRTGAGRGLPRASPVTSADDPADLGQDVRRRLQLERQALAAGQLRRRPGAVGPEVGDGGGHDQRVERGPAVGSASVPRSGGRASRPSTRHGRPCARPRQVARSTVPTMSVTRAPRSSAASAIATPILPVERLPMKRTGSIGSARAAGGHDDVPARQVGLADGCDDGGRRGGVRRADRPARRRPRRRHRRYRGSSARRPTPVWPEASGPLVGLDDRVPEVVAQPARRWRGSPDGVHISPSIAGATTTGAEVARTGRGHDVAGQPGRPSRRASARSPGRRRSRRRCRRRRCGRSGRPGRSAEDVRSRPRGGVRASNVSGATNCAAEGVSRADDVGALGLEQRGAARPPCRRRSSRSRRAPIEPARRGGPPPVPCGRRSSRPSSSGSPPATSAWRIARPLSVRSGSIASMPSRPAAHGAADSPPVRIALTSPWRDPRRRRRARARTRASSPAASAW